MTFRELLQYWFIALLLSLSLVHCSQNKCEPFGDDLPLPQEKIEVTFKTEDLEESITCGESVPLQEFKNSFKRAAPMVKYSNATFLGSEEPVQVFRSSDESKQEICKGVRYIFGFCLCDEVIKEPGGKYLILMVDPDAPSRDNPTCHSWLHWIVGNIKGDDLSKGSIRSGATFTDYNPPTPPNESGPHRYYLFVFKQVEDLGSEAEVPNRCGFSVKEYKEKFHLTAVASNMFTTENK